MKKVFLSIIVGLVWVGGGSSALAQGAPDILWEVPTPGLLANSVIGVGWSAGSAPQVAVGSTDRWLRLRQAASGSLSYSLLGPQHSSGADQTIFSIDGALLAVHNAGLGLNYRVYRASDGFFLGTITVTVDDKNLARFSADLQLQAADPSVNIARFRLEEFTVVLSVGSGYRVTNTTLNFSPNGAYQSAASVGQITIQSRNDGAIISQFAGGAAKGVTPLRFTPDSNALAAWDSNSNRTTLWRVSDHQVLMQFPDAGAEEGVSAIRFTANGSHLVISGYLAFLDKNGLWQQVGVIRFWQTANGKLLRQYDQHTGTAVTSAIAWSPNQEKFAYGTYEGSTIAARSPIASRRLEPKQ